MPGDMDFYTTSHFEEKNTFETPRLQDILERSWAITDKMYSGIRGSLEKAVRDAGDRIYCYYKTSRKKYVIVIGRDLKTGAYNVLVTIYKTDAPGWISHAFARQSMRKRKRLREVLKFNRAIVNRS